MRRFTLAVAVLALASCVSYTEMKSRAPMIAVESSRGVDQVVACIAPLWAEFTRSTVIPDGPAKVINATGAGPEQVIMQATVWPTPTGSLIEYRQMTGMSTGNYRRAQDSVGACR